MAGAPKRFMLLNRRAPHGTIYGLEGLEVALIGAAFDQDICLAFVDDGVFRLKRGQNPSKLGSKHYAPTHGALGDYGITRVYVEDYSLRVRGLERHALLDLNHELATGELRSSLIFVSSDELSRIIEQQDVIMEF